MEQVDGTIVAGASSTGSGSLFVANGGTYKLHITPSGSTGWHIKILNVGAAGGSITASDAGTYVPPDMTAMGTAPIAGSIPPPGAPTDAAPAPAPASTPVPTGMTAAQARALVLIKGDNGEGTGFLVKMPTGPVVITNQHVIQANPHLHITTSSGEQVTFTGLQGASDRDLAMIPITDNKYSYLELATDVGGTVQVGDAVVTPGNSEGGEVLLNTNGKVLALGPQRVEISNPLYHGNSGGPVFHLKSGKVIGVATEAMKVDTENILDKSSHENQNSAISGDMRYFGLRLDTVPQWDPYTWARFENEAEFLREFHERSKCLDSYLNTEMNDQTEWGLYYLKDDKIKSANQQVADMANGGDASQKIEAARNLVFNLDAEADTEMDQIQQPSHFYSFNQQRAHDEMGYRQALKKEIDGMGDNVSRISGLARHN